MYNGGHKKEEERLWDMAIIIQQQVFFQIYASVEAMLGTFMWAALIAIVARKYREGVG